MLLTCFKHDFKSLSRTLVPALIGIAGAAAFGFFNALIVTLNTQSDSLQVGVVSNVLNASAVGGLLLAAMLLAAALTVFAVLIFVRFYRSMVTDEAYLTFTLPVTAGQLIASKFIASALWMLIGLAAIGAAGFVVLCGFTVAIPDVTAFKLVGMFLDVIREVAKEIPAAFVLWCLYMLVSAVRSYFQITGAILFGASIVRKNKVLIAIVMVLGVNFVVNTVLSLVGISALLPRLYIASYTNEQMPDMTTWLIVQCAVNALLAAGFWWLNWHVAKKSVNIE